MSSEFVDFSMVLLYFGSRPGEVCFNRYGGNLIRYFAGPGPSAREARALHRGTNDSQIHKIKEKMIPR